MEGIDKWAEPVATSKPFQSPDSHIKEKSQPKAYRGQHTSGADPGGGVMGADDPPFQA